MHSKHFHNIFLTWQHRQNWIVQNFQQHSKIQLKMHSRNLIVLVIQTRLVMLYNIWPAFWSHFGAHLSLLFDLSDKLVSSALKGKNESLKRDGRSGHLSYTNRLHKVTMSLCVRGLSAGDNKTWKCHWGQSICLQEPCWVCRRVTTTHHYHSRHRFLCHHHYFSQAHKHKSTFIIEQQSCYTHFASTCLPHKRRSII